MARDRMALVDVLRKGEDPEADFLQEGVRWLIQEVIEAEVSAQVGAGRYERTDERTTQRNGDRTRRWDSGDLDRLDLSLVDDLLRAEPGDEVVAVLDDGRAEAKQGADIGAVLLDGATAPVVLEVRRSGDANLCRHMGDNAGGDLMLVPGEAALHLEELEQHSEPKAVVPRARIEEIDVLLRQCPMFDQIVSVPRAFHAAFSSSQSWLIAVAALTPI
jgi:hypothetical protein